MLVDLKRCVLNGENGQNGNFFLCRPEALNVFCARPVTSADVIEFGYANDAVKAASDLLDLRVDVGLFLVAEGRVKNIAFPT